jgi:hypothetical protein
MTGQINILATQATIEDRQRRAARARTAAPALTRARRSSARATFRLSHPHLASPVAR